MFKSTGLREKNKFKERHFLRNENAALVIILFSLLGVLSIITKGLISRPSNIINILLQSSIRGVATIGQTFVILTSGIDISIGGVGLVSAILGASLMTKDLTVNLVGYPVSPSIVIPIMLFAGIGWGTVNGLAVSRIGMPPLIVTLATWEIAKGTAHQIGGGMNFGSQPDFLAFLGSGHIAGLPVPVVIFIVLIIVAFFILQYTRFGKSVYAVGGNPVTAWLTGIKVKNIQTTVFIISGVLAGLAGLLNTARTMQASMLSLRGLELDTIGAAVVGGISLMGGRGNLIGAIIGVLIIGTINNAMTILNADPAMQGITKGLIIIIAVVIDYQRRRQA